MVVPSLLKSLTVGVLALGFPHAIQGQQLHARDFQRASALEARQDTVSSEEHMGTPFKGFNGCKAPQKKKKLVEAWFSVIELVKGVSSMESFDPDGEIERRMFGQDIHSRPDDVEFIVGLYSRIFDLYTDQVHGQMIISCEDQYQPLQQKGKQNKCGMTLNSQGRLTSGGALSPGGYAFNTGGQDLGNQVIVICPNSITNSLGNIGYYIQRARADPAEAQDPKEMSGLHRTLLHELLHLNYVSQMDQVIVQDKDVVDSEFVFGSTATRAYGIENVEKKAKHRIGRKDAHLNADTLTWFAIEKLFGALFGTPFSTIDPRRDGPGDILNIVMSSTSESRGADKPLVWHNEYLFYQVPFNHDSSCDSQEPVGRGDAPDGLMDEPVPGGTFKVSIKDRGECEYKNDGTNAGALWCGDQGYGCEWAKDRGTSFVCPEISGKSRSNVVTCSW